MPLGIRPTNDFAFKKTFGTPENRIVLISLLNAILRLEEPIVEVTLENPYNLQDFQDDKLSILDIKAIDRTGAIYDVEMQLTTYEGLVQRIVFTGCELYAGQLKSGEKYKALNPVYSIWLVDGLLSPDSTKVHHVFCLADAESGRVLAKTLEIHTLELARYNLVEAELRSAGELDCWLYWLRHAHDYETARLSELLPQPAMRRATQTLARIAEVTEDRIMYNARERAIRAREWEIDAAIRKGETDVRIETIQMLQGILGAPTSGEQELRAMRLDQLQALTHELQQKLRNRTPAQ
jgi:predicted transposase/invertase (TIGR01784 family)